MPEQTCLYWGDNGIHEFWESSDRTLLVLRNHPDDFWSAHLSHNFLFFTSTLEDAVKRLNVQLSRDQVWARKGHKFILKAETHGQQPLF